MTELKHNEHLTVEGGEHTAVAGPVVIALKDAHVIAERYARVDAWDESVVEARRGSSIFIWSPGVTVRKEEGARVSNRAGGTVIKV